MTDEPNVLTVREVAEMFKVHQTMIYKLLKRGQIPGFRLGSDWRFNREQLDKWRLSQTATTGGSKGLTAKAQGATR